MKDHFLAEIQQRFPGLLSPEMRLTVDGGQFNDILIADQALVFRFPRYAESVAALVGEVDLLRKICAALPLPVPHPVYSYTVSPTVGQVFMGYPLIPGQPFWRDVLNGIRDESVRERLAAQLAGFLAALHKQPYQEWGLDLPSTDTLSEWMEMYAEIQTHLYPLMRPDACTEVSAHFENFITNLALHEFLPALRHGDFGPGNIIYDPQTNQISGIIDFGFAAIGDPAIDLAAVSTYGEAFFQRMLQHYPLQGAALERVRFYRGTYALQEALHGWKNNDPEALESGLAGYR